MTDTPHFFDLAHAPKVPLVDGRLISHRLVTHASSGSTRLGLHITQAQPNITGQGAFYPDKDEIIYVIAGSYQMIYGSERRVLGPGEGVYIPAGVVHDWQAGPEGWTIACIFNPPADVAVANVVQEDGSLAPAPQAA